MKLSPVQSLLFLLLFGLTIAGWMYGLHWKQIANGSSFTKEERMMISLQDQITVLTEKNAELVAELRKTEKKDEAPADPDSTDQ